MNDWLPWVLLCALPTLALALTLANLATWPRGAPGVPSPRGVSVLVPARNEQRSIEACVRAALASEPPAREVLVYDDESTDATPAILARLAAEDPRVRIVPAQPLPAGWIGKPHACHRLAEQARGDVLFFVDADTELSRDAVGRVLSLVEAYGASVVTAVPRQVTGTLVERLVVPLLHLTYTSWLFLPLVWRSRDPRLLAANGQLLAVTRDAYARIGGHAAVRGEVVDDMAFARRAKVVGERVLFADGHHVARCRMYRSAREVWRGFSKNLFEGLGESRLALALVVLVYLGAFVAPYVAAAVAVATGAVWAPAALAAVAANVALRAALGLRFAQPPEGVLLHPLGVLVLVAIALNSVRWSLRGAILWSGRTYPSRRVREQEPT